MNERPPAATHTTHQEPSPLRRRLLLLILVLTLVRGLVYLAVMPPWQHYDEPTHFEYVRLIAERKRLPRPDDYDLVMRREIAASMQAADFWKGLDQPTLDFWSGQPPDIGISELQHPPLYYALLAVPQLLVAHQSVESQLYVARLTSLLLYLAVVGGAYGLMREAFPHRRWLPAAVATFVALLPPLTDLMSAVNNDVGATAATTLTLWAAVRLARRGPSLRRVAVTLLLVAISFATKSSAGAVAAATLLVLVMSRVPGPRRRWVWFGGAGVLAVALAASLTWGPTAAHWYGEPSAAAPNRVLTEAPLGRAALALSSDGGWHPLWISQEMERAKGQSQRGQTLTLGAWLRTPGVQASRVDLILNDGVSEWRRQFTATEFWEFHAFSATVGIDAPGVTVYATLPRSQDTASVVYLDGLVLADGSRPTDAPPSFESPWARAGTWGAQPVENLLQNGSAERVWPGLRPPFGDWRVYREPIARVFHSLWDWPRTAWVYGPVLSILMQSFWGRFGWNHVALPAPYFYLLGALTVAGIAGGGLALARHRRRNGTVVALLGVAFLLAWGATILRVHPVFFVGQGMFWPTARYASVAIAPTAALLCLGWSELLPRPWRRPAAWLGLLGLIVLNAVALWTVILPYYYG